MISVTRTFCTSGAGWPPDHVGMPAWSPQSSGCPFIRMPFSVHHATTLSV